MLGVKVWMEWPGWIIREEAVVNSVFVFGWCHNDSLDRGELFLKLDTFARSSCRVVYYPF